MFNILIEFASNANRAQKWHDPTFNIHIYLRIKICYISTRKAKKIKYVLFIRRGPVLNGLRRRTVNTKVGHI